MTLLVVVNTASECLSEMFGAGSIRFDGINACMILQVWYGNVLGSF